MTFQRKIRGLTHEKQKLLSETETNSTSVAAMAVALRGSSSISAISPKIVSGASSATVLVADLNPDLPAF